MHVRKTSWIACSVIMVVLMGCHAQTEESAEARDIERRILAPCCKRQTLEDHDSELARALRVEIERRIDGGERAAAIEDDLVRRYGEDVRAMPVGWDPRALLGAGVASVLALGMLVLRRLLRRSRVPMGARRDVPAAGAAARDEPYEDRLDDELLSVD